MKEVTLVGKLINGTIVFNANMSGKYWKHNFDCENLGLTTLEGAPSSIAGYFYAVNNKLTSLHDVHKIIKSIGGGFFLERNPIKSCILGVLLIEGCTGIYLDHPVQKIINKYLPNDDGFRGVLECQSELLDAGYDEYAKL